MQTSALEQGRRYEALASRDPSSAGSFVAGVRTTGIFCVPGCPARTPLPGNVEFFDTARAAVLAGYRPCKRCRPLAAGGTPDWLDDLLGEVERRSTEPWRDRDLRALGLEPGVVRAWFVSAHGMTFHTYARARGVRHAFSGSGFEGLFGPARQEAGIVATWLPTPLGGVVTAATRDGICLLEFADRRMLRTQIRRIERRLGTGVVKGRNRWIDQLEEELDPYFSGTLPAFTVPTVMPGSPFQEAVWAALRQVPWGETRSYRDIAVATGRPSAVRAVGKANGDNPIAIVVPCHRIVGSDGALRGYGGGLWRKRWLLDLEGGAAA